MRTVRPAFSRPRAIHYTPLAAALALALSPAASAATYFVDNGGDSTGNTLRAAITAANAACAAGTDSAPLIVFTGPFTVSPSSPLPALECFAVYTPTIDAITYGNILQGPAGANCGLQFNYFGYGGGLTVKGLTVKGFTASASSAGVCGTGLTLQGNTLQGNRVGVRAVGPLANKIGGPGSSDRNVVVGNSNMGIEVSGGPSTVENNWVGTANGTTAAGNGVGIYVGGSSGHTITGNLVSGNTGYGIEVALDYGGTVVNFNTVGLNDAQTAKLGNGKGGIYVYESSGPSVNDNTVGGNSAFGVMVSDSSNITVQGNTIGGDGVDNAVGLNLFCSGYLSILDNDISRNKSHGVNMQGTEGTDLFGNTMSHNGGSGVRVATSTCRSPDFNDLHDNDIHDNGQDGVLVQNAGASSPVAIYIRDGRISGNGGKNINLFGSAPLLNDAGDLDGGSNNQQNYPVIQSVEQTDGVTIVNFTLDYNGASNFDVRAYSNSAMGKPGGEVYQGMTTLCGDCSETSGSITIDGTVDNISLTATDTDFNGGTSEFSPMKAALTAPAVSVSTPTVNFGDVLVGSSSSERTVLLRSIGGQPWVIDNINSDGFCYGFPICYGGAFSCSTTCETDKSYATGQSCTLKATFSPNFTGTQDTLVQYCDNTASGKTTITLTGNGVPPPPIRVSPRFWNFGGVPVGGSSDVKQFVVANTEDYGGSVSIDLSTQGEFTIVGENCPSALNSGESCDVRVTFDPTTGGVANGELQVDYAFEEVSLAIAGKVAGGAKPVVLKAPGGTAKADLEGVGLEGGDLGLPESINVGAAVFGGAPVSTTVTLSNIGTGPIAISSITLGSGAFTLVNNCPAVLEAAATCTLTIGFTAPGIGPFNTTLTVVSNSGSAEIPVTGTGQTALSPLLRIVPVSMGFGDRIIGSSSATQQVTIINIGGAAATLALSSTTIDFLITAGSCGTTLQPTASCTAEVGFRPLGFGQRNGSLVVTSNAPNSPQQVTLVGTGCRPFLASGNRIGELNNCAP